MDGSLLAGWDNFYVITGSAAGGLTGLTFVVIALVADAKGVTTAGLRGFVTPTIVHFGAVLALAAFVSVPHQRALTLSVGFALAGLGGLIYQCTVAGYLRTTGTEYVADGEDWTWHVILPMLAYATLAAAAYLIWRDPGLALAGVASASLGLLFIGIHNAWDIAVWMTVFRKREPKGPSAPKERSGPDTPQ
jgi:hypothetical protein